MSDVEVDPAVLVVFGQQWQDYGTNEVATVSPYCRTYCGNTNDMGGILSFLDGSVTTLANGFSDHYTSLARVYAKTGGALMDTARLYTAGDQAAKAKLRAALANIEVGGYVAQTSYVIPFTYSSAVLTPTQADSDPSAKARDDMSWDAHLIDWVFHKFTGHHITDPIVAIVGNWTALTAQGEAWLNCGDAWKTFGTATLSNTGSVGRAWTGTAANRFHDYGGKLGDGMNGEKEICLAINLVLSKLAEQFESLFKTGMKLLDSVIRQVEVAAIAMAVGWWAFGAGEAVAANETRSALQDWQRAMEIKAAIKALMDAVQTALDGFHKVLDLLDLIAHPIDTIEDKIAELERDITAVGAVPGEFSDLSHLPAEPTTPFVPATR